MNKPAEFDPFARLFSRLVKNKMGGPGLSVAGLSVGFSMLEGTRAVPAPYDQHLGWLGLRA